MPNSGKQGALLSMDVREDSQGRRGSPALRRGSQQAVRHASYLIRQPHGAAVVLNVEAARCCGGDAGADIVIEHERAILWR